MVLNIKKATEITRSKGTYLLYGPPGTGKTSTIKYIPGKTLLLDIDRTSKVLKGCENVDIAEINNIDTWDHWEEVLQDMVKNKEQYSKYDNVVVDNISELERCILSDLGSKGKNKGVPSQGDYQYLQFRLVNSLRYMKELNVNLIWLAWEDTDLYITSEGQQFNRSYPQINKRIKNNIAGLCDVVGKLTIKEDGTRGYVLSPTNSIYAKNQLDDRKGCLQEEIILIDGDLGGNDNEKMGTV